MDVLEAAEPGAIFLLNSPFDAQTVWQRLPLHTQEQIIAKRLKFFVVDGYAVARETGMGSRMNTIMQTYFFAISGVLPREEAIAAIKSSIQKSYGKLARRWCRRILPPWKPLWPVCKKCTFQSGLPAPLTSCLPFLPARHPSSAMSSA